MDLHLKILLSFTFLLFMNLCNASRLNMASKKMLDVQKMLDRLNKIPLKSIKSPDGDIIDCIDIYQQPAFDHPLLKNHTIQMRPSYYPEGLFDNHTKPITQLWHLNGRCPEGTIPIRRTKKDDLLRAKSIKNYGKKQHKNFSEDYSSHEHAQATVQGNKYYGAKASINLWQPQVQNYIEFSLSQIWILAGSDSNENTIEAGWQVYPELYGDGSPRLFIYWTRDGYRSTGCYNLLCSGFVHIHSSIAIGVSLSPISTYHGVQFELDITIWKDRKQDKWWLKVLNEIVGYWPASLFNNLANSASVVSWGGEAVNLKLNGQHTTTQMGSGHFAEEGFGGASFFRDLQIVDESGRFTPPSDRIEAIVQQPSCYNLKLGKNDELGNFFLYGGPGRNPNCP